MEAGKLQEDGVLHDRCYDDPSQLSQLLQQRAGNARFTQFVAFTATPEPHCSPTATSASSTEPAPDCDAPPPTIHASPRRAAAHARHVKPSLATHHSAPIGIVTENEAARKPFKSFNDAMDVPGDTQPDSQIYRHYTSGLMEPTSILGPSPKSLLDPVEEDMTNGVDMVESTQKSQDSPNATTSPTVVLDDPEAHLQFAPAPTSPLKFETPAMASWKRTNEGQFLSSAVRTATTPGTNAPASVFFSTGNDGLGNPMSLTQAFNATQAKTSPAVGGPTEDPVFQRPSPNYGAASSPIPVMSSPLKQLRIERPLRSSSEPRTEYVTMRQSQERRQSELRDEDASTAAHDSWDEPTEAERRLWRRRARERFEEEAAKSLSTVSAPSLQSARRGKKRGLLSMSSKYKSPAGPTPSRKTLYNSPYDEGPSRDDPGDSPDELSQDIPSSARVALSGTSPLKVAGARVQVPHTSSHPSRTLSGRTVPNSPQRETETPSSQLQRESQFRIPSFHLARQARPKSSRETDTVMDSQPDAAAELNSIPLPKALRFPSSPSTNQYSINQTTVDRKDWPTSQRMSSPPPMPPHSSPMDHQIQADEERVPSSPPLASQDDDDVVYDEHAYDEHSDAQVETPNNADVDMTDQDAAGEGMRLEEYSLEDEDVLHAGCSGIGAIPGADQEIPATITDVDVQDGRFDEELVRSSHPEDELESPGHNQMGPPRLQRQTTIPESDVLEDTQPSYPPMAESMGDDGSHAAEPTIESNGGSAPANSAKLYQPTQETRYTPEPKDSNEGTEGTEGTDASHLQPTPRVRSLKDIANLPQTQQSTDPTAIEMPQLFSQGLDDELDAFASGSSPTRLSKKRKVTYSVRRKPFSSSINDTDPLSEPPSSPLKHVQQAHTELPPSVPTRKEVQPSVTASNASDESPLTTSATLKASSVRKPTKSSSHRKGALKPVDPTLFRRSPEQSPSRSRLQQTNVTPVRDVDVDMRDADSIDTPDELAGPTPSVQPEDQDNNIVSTVDCGEEPTRELLFPHRVFAYWPGNPVFYPATCLGRADPHHLRIRYDDGNIHPLDPTQVRAFDLHVGDHVKVDQKGMKKYVYLVVGFKDKIQDVDADEYPLTDCHGYATVVLEERQRESLPKAQLSKPKPAISVPMAKIYLTNQLWVRYRDRAYRFTPPTSPCASVFQVQTPGGADGLNTPTVSRRSVVGQSFLKVPRAASEASSARSGSGIFANMAFSITFTTKDESAKQGYAKLIKSNGGRVLESGFHELFDPELLGPPPSITQSGTRLRLKDEHKGLGFVALISDAHCRTGKFMQALALNVPCLHMRWIQDCVSASRALSYAKYLLPAGLSTYLAPSGVLKSRTINMYGPDDEITFAQMVQDRSLLLQGQSILMITGKSKKEQHDREFWTFLTHALGPTSVACCTDLSAVTSMLEGDGEWDCIYVEGSVEGAAHTLFGHAKPTVLGKAGAKDKKKRKRMESEELEPRSLLRKGKVAGKNVRLICDEFIIQSLILEAPAE